MKADIQVAGRYKEGVGARRGQVVQTHFFQMLGDMGWLVCGLTRDSGIIAASRFISTLAPTEGSAINQPSTAGLA